MCKGVPDRHDPDTNMSGDCLFNYNPQKGLSGKNRYHDKKTYTRDRLKFQFDTKNITCLK